MDRAPDEGDFQAIKGEALRLLSVGEASAELTAELRSAYVELRKAASPRLMWKIFDIETRGGSVEFSPELRLEGAAFAELCRGCGRAALIAATLGAEADRLIARAQRLSMSRAALLDACASAEIERLCDAAEPDIARAADGSFLSMRFSPGYGGTDQRESSKIIAALGADRAIGLSLTASGLLVPLKSITAAIGLCSEPRNRRRPCEGCAAAPSCRFRMKGAICGV